VRGGGGGVLGVLIGGSEPEWEMRRTGWGDRRGALCTGFTLVIYNTYLGSKLLCTTNENCLHRKEGKKQDTKQDTNIEKK